MRRLNLNNTSTKKDTFGITDCHRCPPYYDPLEIHAHLWKPARVINKSDPTFLQWEQDPKRSNVDNRKLINPDWQYCCICHVARPPIFKMKPNSIDSMEHREESKLFPPTSVSKENTEMNILAHILTKQANSKNVGTPSETPRIVLDNGPLSVKTHEEFMESSWNKRCSINNDIGEMIEPNNTSRSIMKGGTQSRPGKRMKASIFLDKNLWWVEKADPMTMIIQEKTDFIRSGKKIRVKFIEKEVKVLQKA